MSGEENALNDSMDDSPSSVPTPASQRSSGVLSPTLFGSMPSSMPISLSAAVGQFLNVPNGLYPGHAASVAAQLLAMDQISLNSQSSSAYNSCPYTPLNSVADEEEDFDGESHAARAYYADEDGGSSSSCPPSRRSRASGPSSTIPTPPNTAATSRHTSTSSLTTSLALDVAAAAAAVASVAASRRQLGPRNAQQLDLLPSFNSRDMLERIEYKRLKMKAARGWDHATSGETSPNVYPFTPKNSFVDSTFEEAYRNRQQNGLENLEPDLIAKKVEEKKRFYRLGLDEAQGALGGIAEGDDPDDSDWDSFPAPFQIELETAQMAADDGAGAGF